MNERDWLILVTLFQKLNISKTADALFISQSALSIRIKYIEEYFGAKLLERTSKGIFFTPLGKVVAEFAKEYLLELQTFKEKVEIMKNNSAGELRIGMPPILVRFVAPDLINNFGALFPHIDFQIVSKKSSEIIDEVRNGNLQFGFVRSNDEFANLQQFLLKTENVYLAFSETFSIADLENMVFVDYRNDPYFQAQFHDWWTNNFTKPPQRIIKIADLVACRELVKQGIGFGFFPELLIRDEPGLFKIPATDVNGKLLQRRTRLVYKKSILEQKTAHDFLNFIKKTYRIKEK